MKSIIYTHSNSSGSAVITTKNNKNIICRTVSKYWRNRYIVIMLFIGLVYYAIFCYGPIYGIQIAFKDYKFLKGISASPWIGLENFKMMFGGSGFLEVFKNTIIISFLKLVFGFPAPVILALMLNEVRHSWYKRSVQTISYLPHFISWVVISGILLQVLSPSSGAVNYVIKLLGFNPIFFMGDSRWFRFTLIITSIWKNIGYSSIIYFAAISNINTELYEASFMDGATRMKRIWHITIPGMMPIIMIQLILSVGSIIGDDFDQIFNMYNEAVYNVADVISTYTYRMGLVNLQYGFSTAVSLSLNVIAFVLIIITNIITSRRSEYGIW